MQYLVLLLCCVLSTTKASVQGAFSRRHVVNLADTSFFNSLIFLSSALLFLPNLFGSPWQIWPYAVAFGAFSMIFQLSYTKALTLGNVSLTIMFANLSVVVPLIFSAIVYREWPSPLQYVGIVLTLTALVINTDFKSGGKKSKLWILLTTVALVSGGLSNCVQKILSKGEFKQHTPAFVSASYLVAAVIAFMVYLHVNRREKKTYPTTPRVFLYALAVGVTLAVFQFIYNYAIASYPPAFVFPSYAGGTIIVSALAGVILFKDKLSRKQLLSIVLGLIAVVLMNF